MVPLADIDERVVHIAPVCILRSEIDPSFSAPLVLRVLLYTAEPTPLSATVALMTQRSHRCTTDQDLW